MKKTIIFALFFCGVVPGILTAGTYRVNNKLSDNPAANIYSSIQDAHDAAFNGDTLMIEGSSQNYSGFICTKKLVIKGPGYYLTENPGLSANKLTASISSSNFNPGSAGTLMMGIEFKSSLYLSDDNLTIRRCIVSQVNLGLNRDNLTITECIFSGSGYLSGSVHTNLVVSNNIFNNSGIYISEGSTGAFLNNVATCTNITLPSSIDIKNNIFFTLEKANVNLPMLPDPNVSYNISITDHFGTDNNNQANVSEGSLFLGALTESTDGKWQLKESSPAFGAGEGGVDCGAFGGPQPYILSGLPVGPVIYEMNVSSYATEDNKLPVTIKVKSH
ncbi:MAG: hypothetical protein JW723_11610 [Bacteroidales bacterium]|nr:hypothetical protein [Bacteroidales bacterium]